MPAPVRFWDIQGSYEFPLAAITNDHKLTCLNQHKFIFLRVLEAGNLEGMCWQGYVPSGDFRANLFPCLFHLQGHLQPATIFPVRCYNLWFHPRASLSCL